MRSLRVAPLLAAMAAVALTTSSTLFARIGETEQECAARYGETIKKLPDNSSGLTIIITFFHGKADAIAYRKIAKDQQLSENEVEILLNGNSGGVRWQEREGPAITASMVREPKL